ncbi:SwmB domain-containing protein, partial [Verminephrobacter eiseniae]
MATTNSVLNATLSSYQLTAGVPVTLTMTFDQDVLYFDPGAIKASIGKVGEPTYKSKSELKIWTATYTPAAHEISVTHFIRVELSKVHNVRGTEIGNTFVRTAGFTVAPAPLTPTLIPDGPAAPKVTDNQMVLSYVGGAGLDDTAPLTTNAGFTVSSASLGSAAISVNSASVNAADNTVKLTLSRAVANLEQVRVSYTKPDNGNGVQDKAGRVAAGFTDQAVTNNTPDTTPPVLITSGANAPKVSGNQLLLSYDEANSLDSAVLMGSGGFTVTSPGSAAIEVNRASVDAASKTVTLTLNRAVGNGEQVSISYAMPPSSSFKVVQDAAGNKAAIFTGQSVINTADTTPPVLITSATAPNVNGDRMVLSYTDVNILDDTALPGSAGFTVTSASPGSTPITVISAIVNAANKTVTLTLSRPVDNGEQVSLSYTKPTSGNVVKDAAGNAAASFTGQAVNNETPDTTPPVLITTGTSVPKVNGTQLVLSYTEANSLDPAALPGNAGFTVTSASPDSAAISVSRASVNAANKTITLTLSRPVDNGEQVSVSYTKPTSGNVVQDAAGNDAANFTGHTVNNETPDTTPPVLITTGTFVPKVNGTQLVLSYTEANSLDPAALTGSAGFTVTSASPGSTPITVNGASVNAANKTVTLTLSRAVENLEQVSVSYTKPTSGNVVQDAAGNDAASFTGHTVNNETPDTTPPVLITTGTSVPKVNGTQLVLSYTEANSLDPAALTDNAGFTVTSASPGSTPITVNSASVNAANKTVTLTLSRPVANGEQVSVSYTKPTSGNVVQDAAGNDAANFTDETVNNETPDTTPPALITSGDATPKVNGTQLVLSYTEANSLDPAALTGSAGFTVTSASRGSAAISVSSASVNAANKTVTLTLSRAVENLEQVSVSYTKPATGNVVQDAAGNDAIDFTDQTVNNETPDTTPPVLITTGTSAPKVNGNQIVLSYTEANSLDPAALAGSGGFAVSSASFSITPISVNSASVDAANKTVTLTLSRAVENRESVSVGYTKPTTGNGVQDAAGNAAANFTVVTVHNNPPRPPSLIVGGPGAPKVNGRELVLSYYLEANSLDPAALTGSAGFTVTSVTGTPITVISAIVNAANKTITLTLSRAVENLEQVGVSYTKPTTGNVVQDAFGNKANDFTGRAVDNKTPDTTPPALIITGTFAPKVNARELVLSYTEANSLDPAALTGSAGF